MLQACQAPIDPGFMELPIKKVAPKKQAKASVCPPVSTTPPCWLPLFCPLLALLWVPLLVLPLWLALLWVPLLALPLWLALLWVPLLCLPLALLCFPLMACFLGLCLLWLWPCLPLFWQSLPLGFILPLGFLSPMSEVSPWALLPLGGGVPRFPPRVLAYTGEGLDPLVAYVHGDIVPEVLFPQEVVFPEQDIARAYRLVENLINKDLLALVAVAFQVASSQTICHLTTEEHTLCLHHWLRVRESVQTLLRSSFVGASEETWNTLVPPPPTHL
ncbi:hypothetical protein DSO57_1006847 [Entomophthora muscae]|uniref:Uncharacterized protein n=1 Tax=Entomophthora muscae TaxID=34485 RepID=A0ACC2SK58_9FUNG|nr:hypothetical protein DSO57_1006847 [Entomophthora muscae]